MVPPHTVAAQLQAGATPVSVQFPFVPWQGGQLKSEVWVRMGPRHSVVTRSLTEACSPAYYPLWSSRDLSLMSIYYRDSATVES